MVAGTANVSIIVLFHWFKIYLYRELLGKKVIGHLGCMNRAGGGTK